MAHRRALITGISGPAGPYLAEFLVERGYHVIGLGSPASTPDLGWSTRLEGWIELWEVDLLDQFSVISVLKDIRPYEVDNFAA